MNDRADAGDMDLKTLHKTDDVAVEMLSYNISDNIQPPFSETHNTNKRSRFGRIKALFRPGASSSTENLRPTAWLDCLRGLAAILVVLHHWNGHFVEVNAAFMAIPAIDHAKKPGDPHFPPYSAFFRLPGFKLILGSGATMVCIFFMASGWVLTQSSLRHIHSQGLLLESETDAESNKTNSDMQNTMNSHQAKILANLSSATLRRAMRLYIPGAFHGFIGMVLVMLRLRMHDPYFPQPRDGNIFWHLREWCKSSLALLNPFKYRTEMPDLGHRYEWVLWTLPLEFYGSLVCFVTTLILARTTNALKRRFFIVCTSFLALLVKSWWVSNFLAGMLLADLTVTHYPPFSSSRTQRSSRRRSFFGKLVFALGLYLSAAPFRVRAWYTNPSYEWMFKLCSEQTIPRYAPSCGAFLMLICLAYSPKWQARLTKIPALRWAGRCSFSLYLCHIQLYDCLGTYVRTFLVGKFRAADRPIGAGFDISLREPAPNDWLGEWQRLSLGWLCFMLIMWPILIVIASLHTRYIDANVIRFARWVETRFIRHSL